jgi:hypothetical protein
MPKEPEAPKVELKKAADVLKAKVPEKVEPHKAVEIPKAVEPPKDAPKAEPPKVAEPATPVAPATEQPVVITQAILDDTAKELESLKTALGNKWTPDMDDKMGKILESKNYDNLIKGGFTPKQAVTQMALMAQGFVDTDSETHQLITKKVEEIKTAAQLTPGSPVPAEIPQTDTDLIKQWGREGYSLHSKVVGKLMNVDADAEAVKRAMGL